MLEKFWIGLLSLLVFALAFNQFAPSLQGQSSPTTRDLKIGVVDFSKVAKKYKKYRKIKRKLAFEEKRIRKELDTLKRDMELLAKEMKLYSKESTLFKEKQKELVGNRAKFVYLVKKYREEFKQKAAHYTKQILQDLEQAIEAYGKINGYDLVLRKYLPIEGKVELNFSAVAYHSKRIDITKDIIKTINSVFKRKNGKKSKEKNKEKKTDEKP